MNLNADKWLTEHSSEIVRTRGIGKYGLMIMRRLAFHDDERRGCFPGLRLLTKEIGAGEDTRTVRRKLEALRGAGYLSWTNGERGKIRMYTFPFLPSAAQVEQNPVYGCSVAERQIPTWDQLQRGDVPPRIFTEADL